METFSDLGEYASLHLLYDRFVQFDSTLAAFIASSPSLPFTEQIELEKFKTSPFARNGEFEKYCALRQAEVMGIPTRVQLASKQKQGGSLSCTACRMQRDVTEEDCRYCEASNDVLLTKGCSYSACFTGGCPYKGAGGSFYTCAFAS
jgi:hypothetical protein